MARGTWEVSKAVMARWRDKNLDAIFRAQWPDSATTAFLPLNDGQARPAKGDGHRHPVPYCIFEQGTPIPISSSQGKDAATIIDYMDVPFQFTIYGKGKAQAVEFATIVAGAFDRAQLNLQTDSQIEIFRDPDFGFHVDDETWTWILQYRLRLEATYAAALS